MKHIFIVNPAAGKKDATENIGFDINEYIKASNSDLEFVIEKTEYPKHAQLIAEKYAASGEPVRLYACGGDGTLQEVIEGAHRFENAEIGIYPSGSGNDFVKAFDIPKQNFLSIEKLVGASSKKLDLCFCNDVPYINVANIGFDVDVVKNTARFKRLPMVTGKLAYQLSLGYTFFHKLPMYLKITSAEKCLEGEFLISVFANGNFYGGSFRSAPQAQLDDGLIDVCLAKKTNRLRILKMLPKFKRGDHVGLDIIEYFKTASVTVETDGVKTACIDGEFIESSKFIFTIKKQAVSFIIPD